MPKQIALTQGKFAIVDDMDFEVLSKFKWYAWCMRGAFYAMRNIRKEDGKKTTIAMHRQILGEYRSGVHIDHVNHNTIDNRRCNLRPCDNQQNHFNMKTKTGSSRFKGVCWDKSRQKWTCSIAKSGKSIHIGRFIDEIEAAKAYDIKAKDLHGEFALLNFPEAI